MSGIIFKMNEADTAVEKMVQSAAATAGVQYMQVFGEMTAEKLFEKVEELTGDSGYILFRGDSPLEQISQNVYKQSYFYDVAIVYYEIARNSQEARMDAIKTLMETLASRLVVDNVVKLDSVNRIMDQDSFIILTLRFHYDFKSFR